MSGFGGFGGFGSQNNNTQGSGFGGFGSSAGSNTGTGFGGFGSSNNNTTGGSIFGGGGANTGGGFGSGGFGSTNTTSPFGAKPAFGATNTSTSGSIFGGGTATSGSTGFGGGGFGSTANTGSTGFGGNAAGGGGGLFGQNKPAFGSGTTGTGGLFGGGSAPATGTPAFGAGASTAFGGGLAQNTNNGTAGTPFQAHIEKDGATSQNAHYQTITFQQPYQGFSLEELRLQDYAQGRRYGNSNGQAGAFGTSTGFGGFGANTNTANTGTGFGSNTNTGGGLFGGNTNTTTPFGGGAQNTGTGFGSNTGGGLFGQNKPATGLFGGSTATSSQPSGGGLFGTANNTSTPAFGGGATGGFGSNTSGGGLFGSNQNQQKPAFGGFGASTTGTGTGTGTGFGASTTGFGSNTNTSTGGGLFGGASNTTTPAFGANNNTQQNSNPFGGFGGQNQQQNQGNTTGGSLFGGGFGANNNQQQQPQNKPLFGGSTGATGGGGLFGGGANTNTNTGGGGLFGGANNTSNTGGGLFGGAKPATNTGGTGLFGNTNTQTNTGGGLFGGLGQNNQTQQNTGGGLFGGAQQQNKPGGLFGSSTNTSGTGGGLFGNMGQNNTGNTSGGLGGSLFGGNQQQPQQQNQLGGSLFGGSVNQQNPNQAPALTASMAAGSNPYGNDQLFASLGSPNQSAGPLATPLSSSQKMKKSAILPQHRINPAASSRLITPQKRLNGLGFNYSSYGTPGSTASNATPGFSSSLLGGGSFSKSLSKSFSASNIRNSWSTEDSILSPGAFNATKRPAYSNTGSMKKLNIDRGLNVRPSLFGESGESTSPSSARKRVSFDANTALNNGSLNGTNGALVPAERESATPSAEEQGYLRSKPTTPQSNGTSANGHTPEMEQVVGNSISTAPQDDAFEAANAQARKAHKDQKPGEYWSEPSVAELKKMSAQELKSLRDFKVGRKGVGEIIFEHPVDLTGVNLDTFFDELVLLRIRNATVYPSKTQTPPMGKGLNVPSTILLENSWPRAQAGKLEQAGRRFEKHVERLKKVEGTDFLDYNKDLGIWKFHVEHYTTYGLDYDEEEDEEEEETTMLHAPPDTPTPKTRTPAGLSALSHLSEDMTVSTNASDPDDTFEFKRSQRSVAPRRNVPGGFDDEDAYYEDDDMVEVRDDTINSSQSFLDERSVGPFEDGSDMEDVASYHSGSDSEMEQNMAGSFPVLDQTTELSHAKNPVSTAPSLPKSILKASRSGFGTPTKGAFDFGGDWTEQLQRTVSPKKQDRQALRDNQGIALKQLDDKNDATPKASDKSKPFSTSIDVMNSLFGQRDKSKGARGLIPPSLFIVRYGFGRGVWHLFGHVDILIRGPDVAPAHWPYAKKPKTGEELAALDDADKAFHESFKPTWTFDGTLTYATPGNTPRMQGDFLANLKGSVVGQHRDIRFAKFSAPTDIWPAVMDEQAQAKNTPVFLDPAEEAPRAKTYEIAFKDLVNVVEVDTPAGKYEQQVWQLASILFDDPADLRPHGAPRFDSLDHVESLVRKDALSEFWKSIILPDADRQARQAKSSEEKAIAHLSSYSVAEACEALIEGKDFRLATLVAQIGGAQSARQDIAAQLEEWRNQGTISEMSDAVRVLYTILSGECSVADGKTGGGAENKAEDIRISTRFGFDWRQAFGLRLWYACSSDRFNEESIEEAVKRFEEELRDGDEHAKPVPWFIRAGVKTGWEDPQPNEREDLLWGLLKIYRSYCIREPVDIAAILAPENATGNPVNARLSWQLLCLLRAKEVLPRLAITADDNYDPSDADIWNAREITKLSDTLTSTFALPLLTPEHWLHALWVLIHLTEETERTAAIKDLLAFNAARIGDDADTDAVFAHLTTGLQISSTWIYEAKAQHARAVLQDPVRETQFLLLAGNYNAAHSVLCRAVAPAAVISNAPEDAAALRSLLARFSEAGPAALDAVEAWAHGGAMYADYLALLDADAQFAAPAPVEPLRRLARALAALSPDLSSRELVERAAVAEMARVVAARVEAGERAQRAARGAASGAGAEALGIERAQVLRLPLAEEAVLGAGRELGLRYYESVMAGGR
ncbi:uncharacterized protein K452DRAFT_313381 [Aplosporella prunicola CBS 121167]|uniref:Peptidase S59 domain-containing protein n=1 Tax=Aplosporella prunicola CBS 121167 TaxID=1176127 RepID=A0A6A6AW30_9PEZI|nr:uncharacterized protein K452DRAFT_313381 [Aplosporella prunicola CBS 121167]KAF2136212.1 hypothetical protein K452DRAFT_313381 [Aplosporella prunicola CBS 121167]